MNSPENHRPPPPPPDRPRDRDEHQVGRAQAPSEPPPFTCIICGAALFGVQCKLICPNCGYREDCSDLFRA